MISAEHAEALRAGRARRLAEDNAERTLAHATYSAWVKEDARLWRQYLSAAEGNGDTAAERDAWRVNARLMPSIAWATSA